MFVNMDTDDSGTLSIRALPFTLPLNPNPTPTPTPTHSPTPTPNPDPHSGTLSIEEFKKAMALHPEIPMAQVEKMFHDMDITHSGEVDYTEFIAAANAKNASVEKPSFEPSPSF